MWLSNWLSVNCRFFIYVIFAFLLIRFLRQFWIFFFNCDQRYAIRRDSKFARAWTRSEFAAGVQRWHGRIASVSWRFFFRQINIRINLLENLQIAKTRFSQLYDFYGFYKFSRLRISLIFVKQICWVSSVRKTNFFVWILQDWW